MKTKAEIEKFIEQLHDEVEPGCECVRCTGLDAAKGALVWVLDEDMHIDEQVAEARSTMRGRRERT